MSPVQSIKNKDLITRIKQSEEEIRTLTRFYLTLSRVNQEIVRAKDKTELLKEVCSVAVKHGGFRMAWVGLWNRENWRIETVASAGYEAGFLGKMKFHVKEDKEQRLLRPVEEAARTGKVVVNYDTELAAAPDSWKAEMLKRKYFSSVHIPFELGEKEVGTLSIYASDKNAFRDRELFLVKELASDIGLGLNYLEKENKLRESEERFRTLLEASPDAVTETNLQGVITTVSPRTLEIHGFKDPKEMIGKSAFMMIAPEDHPRAQRNLEKTLRDGKIMSAEYTLLRKDGTTFIGELDAGLIRDAAGKPKAFIAAVRDITDRKKHEEDLRKFKLAVDAASDHIIITDENAVILYANEAVEKITGFSQDEVVGNKAGTKKLWGGMMPQEFYEKMWETIKNKKKIFTGEVKNRRKNGEVYTALASISPVLGDDGNVRFFVGIERDVTHEKEVDRAKTEFVSLASHQLRTPLTAINWYSEMLLSGDVGPLSEEQSRYLKEVYRGSQRMVRLVNDLLNVSRLEIGGLLVEPITAKLDLLIADIIRESAFMETSREVPIRFAKPKESIELAIDSELLRQVLRNLVNNAIRYCSDDRPDAGVEIRLEKRVVEGIDSLVISITDNGIGIPKEDQHRVFEKFFRAGNAEKTAAGGTGLGLYICKMVVKAWGGDIWFESEEGKGSTFYVTIPLTGMVSRKGQKKLV